jgi:hypothetical protein
MKDGRRARDRHDLMPLCEKPRYESFPRIRDKGSPRIGYEGQRISRIQSAENFVNSGRFIVGVQGEKSGGDPEVPQEGSRMTGVFGEDDGHLAQDPDRAGREVLQIPHRGADQIQNPHGIGAPLPPPTCYKCSRIFFSMWDLGYAPTIVSTCFPSLKRRIDGIDRTPKRLVTEGF